MRTRIAVCAVLALCPSLVALAAAPLVVNQFHRAFSVREVHIQRGEAVRFTNADEFLHQIFIDSSSFKYSTGEQSPGQSVDIVFPKSGTFEVRCEIHPKMAMNVIVD